MSSPAEPHLLPVYKRREPAMVAGAGCYLVDDRKRRYLDFGAGIAVNALGHCHPELVAALTGQAQTLWHCSNWFRQPLQEQVAARLTTASFAGSVFFCNSGLEANEVMVKAARSHFAGQGIPGRQTVITFAGAFHGRSLTALAAAGSDDDRFGPLPGGFHQLPFADIEAVAQRLDPTVAAVMLEPIQGDGAGVRVFPPDQLAALKRLCRANRSLLLYDEVQCGLGRTGDLFAYQTLGRLGGDVDLTPDLLSSAKGLGGGFPVGALLISEALAACLPAGSHGTTFGGNPMAMAVVDRLLAIVTSPGFFAKIRQTGAILEEALDRLISRFPLVYVRRQGIGLMQGLKLAPHIDVLSFMDILLQHRLVAIPAADNVIRILPPLIAGPEEIHFAESALGNAAKACLP